MLEIDMKEQSSVTQRIMYKGVSREGGIQKVDVTVKMLPDMKEFWKFAKAGEAENKQHQVSGDKKQRRWQR